MELWSSTFLNESPEWATCSVGVGKWREVTEENEGAKRIVAKISIADQVAFCALGAPVVQELAEDSAKLYVPQWVLERLGLDGTGEEAEVEWLTEEAFPEATRIVVRPHDSAFFHGDAKEELERAFTRLGVLCLGMTVPVPILELGGYEVPVDIVKLEPASIVLAQGDEVAIEFEEALDASGATVPVAAPTVPTPLEESTDLRNTVGYDGVMVPISDLLPSGSYATPMGASDHWAAAGAGRALGGTIPPPMADGRRWNPWRDSALRPQPQPPV